MRTALMSMPRSMMTKTAFLLPALPDWGLTSCASSYVTLSGEFLCAKIVGLYSRVAQNDLSTSPVCLYF